MRALQIISLLLAVLLLAGCSISNGSAKSPASYVLLLIDYAAAPVTVTIANNELYLGREDTISGAQLSHTGQPIITEVSSYSSWGSYYSGSYYAAGPGLKESTICFSHGKGAAAYGVEFFDLMAAASADACSKFCFTYETGIQLEAASGEFKFVITSETDLIDSSPLIITGRLDSPGNVTLSWDSDQLILESDTTVLDCELSFTGADGQLNTSAAGKESKRFSFSIVAAEPQIDAG